MAHFRRPKSKSELAWRPAARRSALGFQLQRRVTWRSFSRALGSSSPSGQQRCLSCVCPSVSLSIRRFASSSAQACFSFFHSFLLLQFSLSLLFIFVLFVTFSLTATISPLWATTRTACRLPRGSTFNHRFLIPLSAPCRMSTSLVLMGDTLLALKLVSPQCTWPRSSSINLVLALISFQRRFTSTDTLTMQVQPELSKSCLAFDCLLCIGHLLNPFSIYTR